MATTKKRKKWPPHKYWIEYLRENKREGVWLNGQRTISKTVSLELLKRDGEKHNQDEIDEFAEFLERGRNKAINILWKNGEEYYIVGEHRIEGITKNRKYKQRHLTRLGNKLDQRRVGAAIKSTGINTERAKALGLPTQREITAAVKRLELGTG